MRRINYKPLSINDAYKFISSRKGVGNGVGKSRADRIKTQDYKNFETAMMLLLPRKDQVTIPKGKLEVFYRFGLSSGNADWDNCIKTFQDVIAKRYGFNDKMIFRGIVEKDIVPRGREYIEFGIREYKKV